MLAALHSTMTMNAKLLLLFIGLCGVGRGTAQGSTPGPGGGSAPPPHPITVPPPSANTTINPTSLPGTNPTTPASNTTTNATTVPGTNQTTPASNTTTNATTVPGTSQTTPASNTTTNATTVSGTNQTTPASNTATSATTVPPPAPTTTKSEQQELQEEGDDICTAATELVRAGSVRINDTQETLNFGIESTQRITNAMENMTINNQTIPASVTKFLTDSITTVQTRTESQVYQKTSEINDHSFPFMMASVQSSTVMACVKWCHKNKEYKFKVKSVRKETKIKFKQYKKQLKGTPKGIALKDTRLLADDKEVCGPAFGTVSSHITTRGPLSFVQLIRIESVRIVMVSTAFFLTRTSTYKSSIPDVQERLFEVRFMKVMRVIEMVTWKFVTGFMAASADSEPVAIARAYHTYTYSLDAETLGALHKLWHLMSKTDKKAIKSHKKDMKKAKKAIKKNKIHIDDADV